MPVPTITTVANPQRWGYQARLGSTLVRLATTPERRAAIQRSFAQSATVNTSENPEDFTDEYGRVYSQTDFSGGEGQRFAHRRSNNENSVTRFFDSYGVAVDDEDGALVLLNDTAVIDTVTTPTYPPRLAYDGSSVYWNNDTSDLSRVDDPLSTTPTVNTTVTGATGTLRDVTTLGGVVYACDGTEIRDSDGGWAQWSDLNAVRLWVVKNRIIASDGATLYEDPVGAGPHTSSELVTLSGNSVWKDVTDAGDFILATATDGYVYAFGFDGASLTLAAQSPFSQETPCAIGALHGTVLVTTTQANDDGATFTGRLWVGTVSDAGSLVDMRVVREWYDLTDDGSPCVMEAPERDALYTATTDGTDAFLWRYDVEFGALTRDLVYEGLTGNVTSVVKVLGRLWASDDAGNVTRESGSLRTSGWVVGPLVDFFNADNKTWSRIRVRGDFEDGGTMSVAVATSNESIERGGDDNYWTSVKTLTSNGPDQQGLDVDQSRFLSTRITLTGGVRLQSYSVRAMPPVSDEEIVLHVNVSDLVAIPGLGPQRVPGLGQQIWEAIRDEQERSSSLEVYDLGLVWRGSIASVSAPVPSFPERGSVTRTMEVVFRGRVFSREDTSSSMFGIGTFGIGLFGAPREGISA